MDNKITESKLMREKTALVVIDLQKGVVNSQRFPYTGVQVAGQAEKLIQAFLEKDMFVVLVRVSSWDGKDLFRPITDMPAGPGQLPEGWDTLVPEIDQWKGAYRIDKRNFGAFTGTDLDLQLRRRNIDTLVLCGISTGIGVDTTAREACGYNYNQIFVEDAMTAAAIEEHEYTCKYIFPRLGRIRSTKEVLQLLEDTM